MRKLPLPRLARHEQPDPRLDERVPQDLVDGGAFRGVDLQHLRDQFPHLPRVVPRNGVVLALGDLQREDGERVGVEGRPQQAHLQQDHPQRPNVRLEGVLPILADLRRHVVRRPHHALRLLDRVLQVSSDAEIPQLHLP